MTDQLRRSAPEDDEAFGTLQRCIETTKHAASLKQIEMAIKLFWKREYECAIILAAAAEGILPPTEEPHMFTVLKTSPKVKDLDHNLFINWLKHPDGPQEALLSEFEVVIVIMRAISKFIAVCKTGSEDMKKFVRYVFKQGHLQEPLDLINDKPS